MAAQRLNSDPMRIERPLNAKVNKQATDPRDVTNSLRRQVACSKLVENRLLQIHPNQPLPVLREHLKQGTTLPLSSVVLRGKRRSSFPTASVCSYGNNNKARHKQEMDQLIAEVVALKRAHENILMKYHSLIGLVKQLRLRPQACEKQQHNAVTDHDSSSRVNVDEATVKLKFEDLDFDFDIDWNGQGGVESTTTSTNVLVAQLAKSRDVINKSAKETRALRKKVRTLQCDFKMETERVSSQKLEIQKYVQVVGELQHSISMQTLESEERLLAERKASTKIINELIVNVEEGTEVAKELHNTRAALATMTDEHRRKSDELGRKTNTQALGEEEIINLRSTVQNLKEEKHRLMKQNELNDVEMEENRRMLSEALRVLRYTKEFKHELSKVKDELKWVNAAANRAPMSSSSFAQQEDEEEEEVSVAPDLIPLKGNDDTSQIWWRHGASQPRKEDPQRYEIATVQQILSPVLKTLGLLKSEDLYTTTTKQLCELAVMALQQEYSCHSMDLVNNKYAQLG